MDIGTPYSVTIPTGDIAVKVTPTYSMSSPFVNNTGFSPTLNLGLQGPGLGLGTASLPGVMKTFTLGLGSPNYLSPFSFDLGGWNSFTGQTFTIDAATTATPEPPSLLLLGAGLLLLAGLRWRQGRRGAEARG